MAGLTDEQKARIRAEEEARARALAEERYRQEVRAEIEARHQAELEEAYRRQVRSDLEGGRGPAPAVAPAPATPSPVPPPPSAAAAASAGVPGAGTAIGLWLGAGILAAGAIALGVVGFAGGRGEAMTEAGPGGGVAPVAGEEGPPEIVATGEGALAPVAAARWDPSALGFEGFEVASDGAVRSVAATPVRSLDELKASAAAVGTRRPVVPESPLPTADPPPERGPEAAGGAVDAARWDALLEYAPADARLVVGVDGAALKGGMLLRRAFDDIVREAGADAVISGLGKATEIRIPDDVDAGLFVANAAWEKDDDAFMLGLRGGFDGRRLATFLAATDPPVTWAEGSPPRVEMGHGGVVLGEGWVVLAEARVFQTALRARAGNNATLSPGIGPALREARQAPSAFVVLDLHGELARDLGREVPDLAGAKTLLARLDTRGAVTVDLALTLGDAGAAGRVAMMLEAVRASGKEPQLTKLLAGARIHADGPRVRVTQRVSAADAAALYDILKNVDL